ncbi:hypothetical protein [Zwartia sp.]|uniref:hypothetical protein n=1 Tax=Zwartia sp. TaxID=2978004 RepID=UPI0027194585|nr:hypothetical protein [Zwartia sp.]MDO9025299.1 hypothetical protein [Zwartia sp.]
MKKKSILMIFLFLMSGCASQIMQSYIGQPLLRVVEDYGMPVAAFDSEPGVRSFIWVLQSQGVTPQLTTGSATVTGNQLFASTITYPATYTSSSCNYAIYARKTRDDIDGVGAWTVVGYKTPPLRCQ